MALRATIAVVGALAWAAAGNALAQESDDVFIFDFEGPDVLSAAPGEIARGVYLGILRHSGSGGGALGWSVSVTADNARITAINAGLTGRGPVPGLTTDAALYTSERYQTQSWITQPSASYGECKDVWGAILFVVLCACRETSFSTSFSLPPMSSSSIFYVVVEREVADEYEVASLRFVDGCARAQPVTNIVTQGVEDRSQEVVPIKGRKTIDMTLFQGAEPFPCGDAADATDDGKTNISDGLRILMDFFIPDTAIPAPGPFTCGPDPTQDELSCRQESPCG